MDIFTTSIEIGAIAAVITQIIKFLPFIDQENKQHKRLAAFLVSLFIVIIYGIYENNVFNLGNFFGIFLGSLISAFALYKTIIIGLDEEVRSRIVIIKDRLEARKKIK
jgi:MFS-type transporter involved in bile tolerance (Atg22 family)